MRRSAAIAIAVMLLIVAGCQGTATAPVSGSPVVVVSSAAPAIATTAPTAKPVATPTATLAPTATPEPTPKPTATLRPSSSTDPSAGLKIASPYKLKTLDPITQAAYEAAMSKALGSLGSSLRIGIRQVTKSGTPSGFMMVIEFTDANVAQTAGLLDAVAGGSAASMGGKLAKKTILGEAVRYASSAQGAFAAYAQDGAIVYVILPTTKSALAVLTALIKANR
jgi:hypothetical protein